MTDKKRDVILDIEANGLRPDKIWCVVCKDIKTNEIFKFHATKDLQSGHVEWKDDFLKFLKTVNRIIGHNIIAYDVYWLNKILGAEIKLSQLVDTLVLSRLFRPVSPFLEVAKVMKTDNRIGGHSLDAWGERLGYKKIKFNEFDRYSNEMLIYCVGDVNLNHEVYKKLKTEKQGFDKLCLQVEHRTQYILAEMERNGFYLNIDCALKLYQETTEVVSKMLSELQELFPPVPKLKKVWTPKYKQDGTLNKVSKRIIKDHTEKSDLDIKETKNEDGELAYELYYYQEFNPGSTQQIAERLLALGWEPRKFTPAGNPSTDKVTLKEAVEELAAMHPDKQEIKVLAKYGIMTDRQGKAEKWLSLVEEDGRVHGSINPIGAGTHRCSHFNDNMANIASVVTSSMEVKNPKYYKKMEQFQIFDDNKVFLGVDQNKEGQWEVEYAILGEEGNFGWDSRNCWQAQGKDNCIVGADASGIQLRALAHYINDPEYTRKLLEDDIHTVHQHAAGISTRKKAKTFIYAWLLGAGDEKVGSIVGVTEEEYKELNAYGYATKLRRGKGEVSLIDHIMSGLRRNGRKATEKLVYTCLKGHKVKAQFLDRTPALKRFKTVDIPEATRKGYVKGLDGRKLWIPSEHLAMSLYLQGFEAVVMKYAMCIWYTRLKKRNIPFKLVAFVHDEWQIETPKMYAKEVGETVVQAIRDAGVELKSNCPLDGEYKIGRSWSETH